MDRKFGPCLANLAEWLGRIDSLETFDHLVLSLHTVGSTDTLDFCKTTLSFVVSCPPKGRPSQLSPTDCKELLTLFKHPQIYGL